ncbi:haloacid dehalogenase, type II [Virgibacillus phasianinus]|uniref:Haloacid dehalogenase, type II n=1 Tax=Virgibacillus phasianinus TaxID=2017483 RepID=A0A220U0L4_9BACI|nr:haloacid dehalogenase type II [Virgibacillus phasianinus]ASK61496.1 haloacid dehalogenase, type II [Virgibacillus phasianinus]
MKINIKAFVFDVYGTLFDVHSVVAKCNQLFPGKGDQISRTWRKKQLEYANLREIMGNYETFFSITKDALRYAVTNHDEELNATSEDTLLKAYFQLTVYDEIEGVLQKLKNKQLAVFSNGSLDMLDPLIEQSNLQNRFHHVISVDEVKTFKPSPRSYDYAAKKLGVKPEEVLFMSSNGWDICGAKNYGFHTAWINRQHLPMEGLNLYPDKVYSNLTGILEWNN